MFSLDKIKTGNEKGSSLVEVLIALFVLLVLMIGVLQMFAAAFVINRHSSLKTLEAYKCEQVAEVLRMVRVQTRNNAGALPVSAANSGINFSDGVVGTLPYEEGQSGWDFWGPEGANIIEQEGAPYRLFYRINIDLVSGNFIVTVTGVEAGKVRSGENPYESQANLRRVEYVTQMP